MTDPVGSPEVRQHLDRAATLERRAAESRRRYVRRLLIGVGVTCAGYLLVSEVTRRWLVDGRFTRVAVIVLVVGLIGGVALAPALREPVRARPDMRLRLLLVGGGMACALAPVLATNGHPVAAPAGAVLMLAFWTATAWWATRER